MMILPLLFLFGGGYVLLSALAPAMPPEVTGRTAEVTKKLTQLQPTLKKDRLYVPKIGVDVEIVDGATDETLEGGAWHRVPENGDPIMGGNFVLAAHRFNLGLNPDQTRAKSPFYHIDKMNAGDQIFVDFKGTRYAYEVVKRYKVKSDDVSIENKISDTRMTLYSCDLRGWQTTREVVEAKPVGTVAWVSGGSQVQQATQ